LKIKTNKTLGAFTLIELIIVVMIISMVGFLVFSEAVKQNKQPQELTPLTLKSILQNKFGTTEDMEFFCIAECKDCYIIKKGDILPYEGTVKLGKDLEVYMVDKDNRLEQIEEFGRVKDNKICFRYSLYHNGTTQQVILSNSSGVYYLPTYFGEPIEVDDIEEAKELWIKPKYDLRDNGNYY
jgi:hypothetical protein